MTKENKYKSLIGLGKRERIMLQMETAAQHEVKPKKKKRKRMSTESAEARTAKSDVKNSVESEKAPETATAQSSKKRRVHRGNKTHLKDKRRVKKKKKIPSETAEEGKEIAVEEKPKISSEKSAKDKASERLKGSRFRYINERLYTSSSTEAKELFLNPYDFKIYHEGFVSQAQKWPLNPQDMIIKHLKKQPRSLVIADMGCGEAKLAASLKQKVHSFDLVALNDNVTACDMAKVPLENGSIDVCVFCLSLMGTNLADYLREANRILKLHGNLKIVEINSRFSSVKGFLRALSKLGFQLIHKKQPNDYFILFELEKISKPIHKRPLGLKLLPCLYKHR